VKIRALIVDDEPLAREKVARHLESQDDVEIVGECGDGKAAARAIRELAPDLVFLDIQLPEFDAFEVLRRAGPRRSPYVIFVTAYDEHALRAFEVQALDYLVKPFDDARFQQALSRGREHVELCRASGGKRRGEGAAALADRLLVHDAGRIRILRHSDLDWVESAGNYVRLHMGGEAFLYRQTMAHLESSLNPAQFVRIHRCHMVNVDRIQELQPMFKGAYTAVLRDGTRLAVSPPYRRRLSL
jgi:two-component system, LytTR family, response regulator